MKWVEVDGSNGEYLVNEYGDVRSLKNHGDRILKKRISRDGYVWYILQINGKGKTMRANRLVANAFIPNPDGKPTVNHKDGNKKNNYVSNLEWATREEQMAHAYKHHLKRPMRGVLQKKHSLTEEEVREIRRVYKSHSKEYGMIALAKKYSVSISTIINALGKEAIRTLSKNV